MSEFEAKKLEDTEISAQDAKELKEENDTKLDNSNKKTSTTKKKSAKSKSKKDTSYDDVSDHSLGHEATIPKDAGDVKATSVQNIKNKLSDPNIRKEIVHQIADLFGSLQKRKLTDEEITTLENTISSSVVPKVFGIKKLD